MTALQKALELHPDLEPDKIIRYGCPDRYGAGKKPDWCNEVVLVTIPQCNSCWHQEYKEETK